MKPDVVKPKVLVTRRWPEAAEAYVRDHYDATINMGERLTKAQLIEAMREYDGLCPSGGDRLDAEVLSTPDARVKMIANFGVGFEHIDLDAAKAAGIVVSNTPDVLSEATADIAILLMLMTSRRAYEGEQQVRTGAWRGWGARHLLGQSLEGKTLGLFGMGRIGQETARKARNAFGMTIAYHSRNPVAPDIEAELGAVYVPSLEGLAEMSDVLSLHAPGGPTTHQAVDAALLRRMKPTAILINTARGTLIDEAALAGALRERTIWAAGLDVYEKEPIVHPDLIDLPNVVLLPHLGSATIETRVAMGLRAAANLDAFFAGEPVRDRIA